MTYGAMHRQFFISTEYWQLEKDLGPILYFLITLDAMGVATPKNVEWSNNVDDTQIPTQALEHQGQRSGWSVRTKPKKNAG